MKGLCSAFSVAPALATPAMGFDPLSDFIVVERNSFVLLALLTSSQSICSEAVDRVLVARARGQWLFMMSMKLAQKRKMCPNQLFVDHPHRASMAHVGTSGW